MASPSLKEQWDNIPDNIKTFAPKIRKELIDFWTAATAFDRVKLTPEVIKESENIAKEQNARMDKLSAEFDKAGGTDDQWNTICMYIESGEYDNNCLKP